MGDCHTWPFQLVVRRLMGCAYICFPIATHDKIGAATYHLEWCSAAQQELSTISADLLSSVVNLTSRPNHGLSFAVALGV